LINDLRKIFTDEICSANPSGMEVVSLPDLLPANLTGEIFRFNSLPEGF